MTPEANFNQLSQLQTQAIFPGSVKNPVTETILVLPDRQLDESQAILKTPLMKKVCRNKLNQKLP